AFGCVLFEMLTGRPAFEGETVAEIFGGIVKGDPEWSLLPPKTSDAIRKLIGRCLHKDRMRRLQHIGEARIQIDDALSLAPQPEAAAKPRFTRRERIAWMTATAFAVGFAVFLSLWLRPARVPPELRLAITTSGTTSIPSIAISPDARTVAFVANNENRSRLWIRP